MMSRILWAAIIGLALAAQAAYAATWECQILPPEQKIETDAQSGMKVTFATTNAATDTNFYFHERCFLWNNRLMLFNSDRFGGSEVMGYLLDTGELIRLMQAGAPGVSGRVASIKGDRVYVVKENALWEWKLEISLQPKTSARVTERRIVALPDGAKQRSSLDENCDGSLLAIAYTLGDDHYVGFCDIGAGALLPATKLGFKLDHLQFHRHRPDIISFSRTYDTGGDVAPLDPNTPPRARIWTMSLGTREPIPAFFQKPGELATHECWWVNDQMTFVGGFHRGGDAEEGSIKVLDFKTGDIRIMGSGAWVNGVPGKQLAEVNWWHASGSPNGKWVVGDNWHGVVALFNATTTEEKILATGHRTYGKGLHPHAGWDLEGKHVEFTSNKLGNPDVCIIDIPEKF